MSQAFCLQNGLSPTPAAENQLCLFVSSLANEKLCHNTIKCYMAAIRHLHIADGWGDPHISNMSRLEQVLRGIKSVQAKGPSRASRLPITPNLMLKLKKSGRKKATTGTA